MKLIAYEKPTALSTNEALEMMKLTRAAGVKTVVSHQHRYGEHYKKVKEIIASGAIGRVHTVYGTATGWMMHMLTHLIDYTRWYNDYAEAEWVVGQAHGKSKFADNHPSPDYIGGLIQFANGVRGIVECGDGAPDVPEVEYWWRKCRIGAQGSEGFAEVLTGGGWRAVTRQRRHVRPRQHGLRARHGAVRSGNGRLARRREEDSPLQRRKRLQRPRNHDGPLPLRRPTRQSEAAPRPRRTGTGSAEEGAAGLDEPFPGRRPQPGGFRARPEQFQCN